MVLLIKIVQAQLFMCLTNPPNLTKTPTLEKYVIGNASQSNLG